MITPTVGRVVWFHPGSWDANVMHYADQPLAGIITYVWNDRMVNLAVFDANGAPQSRTSVRLLQDDDHPREGEMHATWMPYQKGQAARTEAAEARLFGTPAAAVGEARGP
jgi:hypothetical protein